MTYLNSVHGFHFPPDQHWFCAIATALLWAATMSSTLFILSMTFDRVYSIIRPHKAASFNTVKRAKITIIIIIIFSCLFNVPYLFTLSTSGLQCIMDLTKFENRFYFWLSCVVQFIIPFVRLLSMNSVIIRTLRNRSLAKKIIDTDQGEGQSKSKHLGQGQSEGQGQNTQTKSSERQIFAILLLVAFSFFVLITPLYAFNIYVQIFDFIKSPNI